MNRKHLIILLSTLCALSMTACNKDEAPVEIIPVETETTTEEPTETENKTETLEEFTTESETMTVEEIETYTERETESTEEIENPVKKQEAPKPTAPQENQDTVPSDNNTIPTNPETGAPLQPGETFDDGWGGEGAEFVGDI